jgi:hypothetical protein
MASAFVVALPVDRWFHALGKGGIAVIFFLFFAGAAILMLMAESRFRDGIQNGIWSEEELAPLRAVFTSPWMTAFSVAGLIAFITVMFLAPHPYRGLGWSLFIVNQSLMRLQMAFRRKTPKNPAPPTWSGLAPIQSEHWGER